MTTVAQPLQRGRAGLLVFEAGRQLRPYLTGRGMFASHQSTGALDGGVVQIVDNQHQDALRPTMTSVSNLTRPARPMNCTNSSCCSPARMRGAACQPAPAIAPPSQND
jgi:hypothetical protein